MAEIVQDVEIGCIEHPIATRGKFRLLLGVSLSTKFPAFPNHTHFKIERHLGEQLDHVENSPRTPHGQ